MRILYHHRTQGEEPESVHILAMVDAFRQLGHEVKVVGPSARDLSAAGSNAGWLAYLKRRMPPLLFELAQLAYNAISWRRLRREIRSFSPDLIYERYALYHFAGPWLARRLKIPLILEVNTPYAHAWRRYYRLYLPAVAKWMEQRILNRADHVVTVTGVQKQFLAEHYLPAERIVVCQNGVDPERFRPNPRVADASEITVGFVGCMNRWQGVPLLKTVIPQVLAADPRIRFLLVGDGEYVPDLKNHLVTKRGLDRVTFAGRRPHREIPSLIDQMDITILPDSNDYGSPMKVFEYMAMGKAVVAPDVAPVREVVRDGVDGVIVPRGEPKALCAAILSLVASPDRREQMGREARHSVLANYTWRRNAETIERLYHAGIASRTANRNGQRVFDDA